MSDPKGKRATALPERFHVYEQVAAERNVDIDRLRADIADRIREPLAGAR